MNRNTIVKPCHEKVYQQDGIYCGYNTDQVKSFTPDFFDSEYWQSQGLILDTATGRGTTYFVQHEQKQWVLRHYYRGGLIGKIFNDGFIYLGMENSRAVLEYQLLNTMHSLGLPVPEPVAYRVIRHGMYYQCDLITARIINSQDLVAVLSHAPLDEKQWRKIGQCIAQFHRHGIYHHDLNSHNILLDSNEKIWLIDFDRGSKRPIKQSWQQANMSRLHRSFRKEKARLNTFHWQECDWQYLMEGYLS
ncbi:3-deoxy-D-manno-octulosonic acid kinase [Thalassotalea fusca]